MGDPGSIPGLGRSPGGGHGNPLQDSCLENPMDRGAWQATVPGVAKSRTKLSSSTHGLSEPGGTEAQTGKPEHKIISVGNHKKFRVLTI